MERGTVEWNSGMERAINDPVPFYLHKWANWACALTALNTWDGEATCYWRAINMSLQLERVF